MKSRPFNAKYFERDNYHSLEFGETPKESVEIIISIPAYNEPDLLEAIDSLYATSLDYNEFEVHILLNNPIGHDSRLNKETFEQLKLLPYKNLHCFFLELPKKHAGVGMARKILMDNACNRFYKLNKPNGVVLAYDADCTCVNDHVYKVLSFFNKSAFIDAASIYFEHPYKHLKDIHQKQIIQYELHLRCYINWKKHIELPYAFQTIGSSMAVRAGAYTSKGGMNKRKAGEDFYFLHKFTHDGRFAEIKDTCVYPSARISDRVPFGTGRAILEAQQDQKEINSYNPNSFLEFQKFISQLKSFYEGNKLDKSAIEPIFLSFLESIDYENIIQECLQNASNWSAFEKRVFHRFDAFKFMKYLHYMRDHSIVYENVSALASANVFFEYNNMKPCNNSEDALIAMREFDKA